jgi:predicted RNA-binding Zn ribbon-like protein
MKRIGGRLCLDFTNTVSEWHAVASPRQRADAFALEGDRIPTYADLLDWAAEAIEGSPAPRLPRRALASERETRAVLRRAHALRAALYRLLRLRIEGKPLSADDLETIDAEWRLAREAERLQLRGDGFEVVCPTESGALDQPLAAVVRSAIELLTSPELARVKYCPGEHCGWLFLDTSRSGRRRWCDMSDCGNLDKVRRFRQRKIREAAPSASVKRSPSRRKDP